VKVRNEFPILTQMIHGHPLVYLDSAATTQKPQSVIDAISNFYQTTNSNVHRGVHALSEKATVAYEESRKKIQAFIGAKSEKEIIFTRGTTESINVVAHSYGGSHLKKGDEVLISAMEHHSNIVPWQMLCDQTGATLRILPMNQKGELILEELDQLLTKKTKIVAVVHVSNALGTVNPIEKIIKKAHEVGAVVVVDGAQAAAHMSVNVAELDCDFYTLSGHKMYGPTGIGVLYGKTAHLESMPPYQGGGDMIRSVTFKKTTYNEIPFKFEAGTPHIVGAIGLGVAIDFLNRVGLEAISKHEAELLEYGVKKLGQVPGLRFIGTADRKASVISFTLDKIHPHDVGTILDQQGIAVRTGHHCAQPVMEFFGVPATIRASVACYSTKEEFDVLVKGLGKVMEVFK
jgi:cysteine desulfurase / selenocysteine lyase